MELIKLKNLVEKKIILANIKAQLYIANHVEVRTNKEQIIKALELLKDDKDLEFAILTEIFAADFPEREKRFEVVYSLLSIETNSRLIIKIYVEENEIIPSATSVFNAANWYEREIYDLFGVKFQGHPNLDRILTDYGFIGHPLRKDFALSGYVQIRYDDKLEQVVYEPVKLDQEYRNFDFLSPWQGPKNKD